MYPPVRSLIEETLTLHNAGEIAAAFQRAQLALQQAQKAGVAGDRLTQPRGGGVPATRPLRSFVSRRRTGISGHRYPKLYRFALSAAHHPGLGLSAYRSIPPRPRPAGRV